MEKRSASRPNLLLTLVPTGELDTYGSGIKHVPKEQDCMEKPTTRGPSPGRKAVHALGARLNRKSKRPPPLLLKKKASSADRTTQRQQGTDAQ
jgi:hypothetical protein